MFLRTTPKPSADRCPIHPPAKAVEVVFSDYYYKIVMVRLEQLAGHPRTPSTLADKHDGVVALEIVNTCLGLIHREVHRTRDMAFGVLLWATDINELEALALAQAGIQFIDSDLGIGRIGARR